MQCWQKIVITMGGIIKHQSHILFEIGCALRCEISIWSAAVLLLYSHDFVDIHLSLKNCSYHKYIFIHLSQLRSQSLALSVT